MMLWWNQTEANERSVPSSLVTVDREVTTPRCSHRVVEDQCDPASLRWLVAFTPIEDEVRYLVRSEDLVRIFGLRTN